MTKLLDETRFTRLPAEFERLADLADKKAKAFSRNLVMLQDGSIVDRRFSSCKRKVDSVASGND